MSDYEMLNLLDVGKCKRAGTRFSFRNIDKTPLEDKCIIYPDDLNDGWYVALSKNTGKVGQGKSVVEAYSNLIVAIACAINYKVESFKSCDLRESEYAIWKNDDLVNSISRLEEPDQNDAIDKAKQKIVESSCISCLSKADLEKTIVPSLAC